MPTQSPAIPASATQRSQPLKSAVLVRRATTQDAAAFVRIFGDMEVLPGLLQMPFPCEDQWRARLTNINALGNNDLQLVAERTGEVVGMAGLHAVGTAVRRRHVMTLGMAVAAHAQGQGVGSALLQAMCDYADQWAQVLRLELVVYTDNHRAIALYRRFGFEDEGVSRADALRGGQYVDTLRMGRLHPAPPQLPQPRQLSTSPGLAADLG